MVATTPLRRTMIEIPLLLVHLVGGNLVGDAHSQWWILFCLCVLQVWCQDIQIDSMVR
jgi:hypothetical protein